MAQATKSAVKFKPLKERVFVSYSGEPEKTSGGLYIPDAAKEKPQKGKIEAIGGEVKTSKSEIPSSSTNIQAAKSPSTIRNI